MPQIFSKREDIKSETLGQGSSVALVVVFQPQAPEDRDGYGKTEGCGCGHHSDQGRGCQCDGQRRDDHELARRPGIRHFRFDLESHLSTWFQAMAPGLKSGSGVPEEFLKRHILQEFFKTVDSRHAGSAVTGGGSGKRAVMAGASGRVRNSCKRWSRRSRGTSSMHSLSQLPNRPIQSRNPIAQLKHPILDHSMQSRNHSLTQSRNRHISTCTPNSTTRSGGRRKNAVARTALRAMTTNSFSRQTAIPRSAVTISVSLPRK